MLRIQFHIRTVIIAIQMLLVLLAGGTAGYLSYKMEITQSQGHMLKVLSRATQDINFMTEIFLEQVKTGANQIGRMAENHYLTVEKQKHLAQVFKEYHRGRPMIAAVGYIDAATGNATFVGQQPDRTIITRITEWDSGQKAFSAKSYSEKDQNLSNHITSIPQMRDPRATSLFMEFQNRKAPGWTYSRIQEESPQEDKVLVFSYCFPVLNQGGSLRGLLYLDMDLTSMGNYLNTRGEELGYGGFSFALEKKTKNEMIVIGNETLPPKAVAPSVAATSQMTQPLFDSAVLAFKKILAQRMAQSLDPFNVPGEMVEEFKCSQGVDWISVSCSINPGVPPEWIVVALARRDLLFAESYGRLKGFLVALVLILVATSTLGFWLSGFLSLRLNMVSKDANLVRRLEIKPTACRDHFIIEIDHLVKAIEEMKAGLLSFQKFVPTEVVRKVVASGKEAVPGGEKKNLTLLFTDLADFTSIAEKLSPEQLVFLVSEHLAMGSRIVKDLGGTIDKFIGDSLMAFWNAPDPCEDHPHRAVLAALRIQQQLELANASYREKGLPELNMRIGLNTGPGVVGNIGTENRLNYTVLGDSVNLASRLEAANKYYGTRNLVSHNTVSLLLPGLVLRPVDCLAVWGKVQGLVVYEALGIKEECPDNLVELARRTWDAWSLYLKRDWPAAASAYENIRDQFQQDSLAATMAKRCRDLERIPPKPDWDGTWRLADK